MARMLNATHAGRGLQPCPECFEVTDGFVPCEKPADEASQRVFYNADGENTFRIRVTTINNRLVLF